MRILYVTGILIFILSLGPQAATATEVVSKAEALTVAQNWIQLIISAKGDWGGSQLIDIDRAEELRRGNRLLGYWCHLEPQGFIVVSLRRELAPVKAYSETWDADPGCDLDLVDVIKYKMNQAHDIIEQRVGPFETASPGEVESILDFSYREEWERLNADPAAFRGSYTVLEAQTNYEMGQIILTDCWSQDHPYNLFCPSGFCTKPNYHGRCATGCVATAAAQIMRHWCWPPYGTEPPYHDPYNWTLMPGTLEDSSPQPQIDAVANLMSEIGQACSMDYCSDGCASSAYHDSMVVAYEGYFRYDHDIGIQRRPDYDSFEWFDVIRNQLNVNRPLQYEVPGHSLVCDGWQQVGAYRAYHMNYGWANGVQEDVCWDPFRDVGSNIWFTVDYLPCSDLDKESIIAGIRPDESLGANLGLTYGNNPSFPYRYVDVDATGASVTFSAGQLIQFLPGVIIRGTSMTGSEIRILGTPAYVTRLFTRGDASRGVRIENGGISLTRNGAILLY